MTLLSWLVEASVRLTLVTGLAAAALWLLRVRSADAQLRVWTGVIVASCLLPWLPEQWVVPVTISMAEPAATSALISSSDMPSAARDGAGSGWFFQLDIVTVMLAVYFLVAGALLARLLVGVSWARRLTAEATPVSGEMFFESHAVHAPVTAGLLRPRIIVPRTWREWPADMLAAVRAHEGAHVSRRDGLWLSVALLHRALQWFNPLSWWIARHMTSLSERASDDAALMEGIARARYAEILLTFATTVSTRHRRVAWVVAMASPSGRDTERRLDRVLTWKGRPEMTRSQIAVLALVLMSGSAAVYTAGPTPISVVDAVTITPAPSTRTPPVITSRIDAPDSAKAPGKPHAKPRTVLNADKKPAQSADQKAPPVVVAPVATKRVFPKYTPEAMRAKIQGMVTLLVTIDDKGVVTGASVAESLDAEHGLDNNAIDAVMQWSFRPGTIDGVARPFTVKVSLEFRLH